MEFFNEEPTLVSRGENALESGHVQPTNFDGDLRCLKGKVDASMRDKVYDVEIWFNDEWNILKAQCSCPRGQLLCHHMAGIVLYGRYNISVTDKQCVWNASSNPSDDSVKTLQDLFPPKKHHRTTTSKLTDEEIKDFREKLNIFDGAVGFTWLLLEDVNIIPDVESILFSQEYLQAGNKSVYIQRALKLKQEDIPKIATQTVGQSKNPNWLTAHKHRLTASNFGMVLAAVKRNRYPPSLFKRLSGAYNMEHIKAIQWEKAHEEDGIKALELSSKIKIVPTGLWLHECGFIGATPDGFVNHDAIIEDKCPYRFREASLYDYIKTHSDYDEGNVSVNKGHEYYYQIQGQLALTKRKKCYLVIWTQQILFVQR